MAEKIDLLLTGYLSIHDIAEVGEQSDKLIDDVTNNQRNLLLESLNRLTEFLLHVDAILDILFLGVHDSLQFLGLLGCSP